MKKSRAFPLDPPYDQSLNTRLCEKEGCEDVGEFRAPKTTSQLREYYWFCLEHVREYNKEWDFYRGMSLQEIENSRLSDITWNRPSWPIGGWRTLLENVQYLDGIDPFLKAASRAPTLPPEVHKALQIFDLALPLTVEKLKAQYKVLAKRHHPDLNGGNKHAEEQLKEINDAYQVLKKYV